MVRCACREILQETEKDEAQNLIDLAQEEAKELGRRGDKSHGEGDPTDRGHGHRIGESVKAK